MNRKRKLGNKLMQKFKYGKGSWGNECKQLDYFFEKTSIKTLNFQVKAKKTLNSCLNKKILQLSNFGHFNFYFLLTRPF